MLVYVDDLRISENENAFIKSFPGKLNVTFPLKNPSFLGVQVDYIIPVMKFLSQAKYLFSFLLRTKTDGAKPITSPAAKGTHPSSHDELSEDPTFYQTVISAL